MKKSCLVLLSLVLMTLFSFNLVTQAFADFYWREAGNRIRDRKAVIYEYSCIDHYPGGTIGDVVKGKGYLTNPFMIGEHHFVYRGWNYEEQINGEWQDIRSRVYPFDQVGPAIIIDTREYWTSEPNPHVDWCPKIHQSYPDSNEGLNDAIRVLESSG